MCAQVFLSGRISHARGRVHRRSTGSLQRSARCLRLSSRCSWTAPMGTLIHARYQVISWANIGGSQLACLPSTPRSSYWFLRASHGHDQRVEFVYGMFLETCLLYVDSIYYTNQRELIRLTKVTSVFGPEDLNMATLALVTSCTMLTRTYPSSPILILPTNAVSRDRPAPATQVPESSCPWNSSPKWA